MKKIFITIFFISAIISKSRSQYVTIPDQGFRNWLTNVFPGCFSGQLLDTTCTDLSGVSYLSLDQGLLSNYQIQNLDGLQYFKSLTWLDLGLGTPNPFGGPYVTSIPAFPKTIQTLKCYHIGISSFPAWPDSLKALDMGELDNVLALPLFPSKLKWLNMYRMNLPVIPALPYGCEYFHCFNCYASLIPFLPNSMRDVIPEQSSFSAFSQTLLPDSLRRLDLNNDQFFDVLPATLPDSLQYFRAYNNGPFTTVPQLPPSLDSLILAGTGIVSSLPELPASLRYLNILGLQGFDCLPRLPLALRYLDVPATIKCLPNSVPGLIVYGIPNDPPISLPLCNVITNVNHCISFPNITGHFFYDNNSNGVKDPGENFRPNVGVGVSNGEYSFSDSDGYFEVSADTGNIVFTVATPAYYQAVPTTINFHFNTNDTITNNLIPLQPVALADSVSISIVPIGTPRPGNIFSYNISYENTGTTTIASTVIMNYDGTALSYVSSSNPTVIQGGSAISLSLPPATPGTRGSFTANFLVGTGVAIGNSIHGYASANGNGVVAYDSTVSIVVNSFDPNDKSATAKLTTQQVSQGKYIDYVVRFQNTGTANAINIVITDTLSSFLKENSLQIINASHRCKTTREGKNISFEFINIQLPGMNVNEPASHGFIKFRVQPIAAVPVNTLIPNKAAIYFDYNVPVITNIANTLIDLTTVPLSLLSFKALTGADNNALLFWNTADEFNTAAFDIEQSIDGRTFTRIGNTAARGRGSNTYSYKTIIPTDLVYYRLKMIDLDGRFTYSQVIQVKRNKNAASIVVLSNPTKNTLSLINTDATLVNTAATIINEQGVVVKKFILNDGLQNIDVSNLSTGVYYLKTAVNTKKIIINH